MKKLTMTTLIALTVLALNVATLNAQEAPVEEISPEQQAIMANMQAYGTLNENHELLAKLAGSWNVSIQYWMNPEMPPQTSEGAMKAEVIMGGKFLEQSFNSEMEGQPFEGRGFYGFDNIQKKFQSIWFDSMGTGIMSGTGDFDAATQQIKEEGSLSCPITNGQRWYRAVTTIIDNDHYNFETFMKDEEDIEFRSMVINYTRIN